MTSANVDIRKIIEIAIKKGASSIAIAHNHPSGDPSPSFEDVMLLRKLSSLQTQTEFHRTYNSWKKRLFSFRRDGRFDDPTTIRLKNRGCAAE
ncbi:MAG: JAB domain-containing protein [Bacilli bacterium]